MNKIETKLFVLILVVLCIVTTISIRFGVNVHEFNHCIQTQHSSACWFDARWLHDPYTNLRLSSQPSKYYITTNVLGDIWVVRSVTYHGKEFWTIDYQIKKESVYEKKHGG